MEHTIVKEQSNHGRSTASELSGVEYNAIAELVMQQYSEEDGVNFEGLLSIPIADRIPSLMERYGNKTMHQLLVMILTEFFASLPLPKYKKPTETKTSLTVCEIMLDAEEDQLSIEDLILFLQRTKAGVYGKPANVSSMAALLTFLEIYRDERHQAYIRMKEEREEAMKQLGPLERTAPEPASVENILKGGIVVSMNRRMSG